MKISVITRTLNEEYHIRRHCTSYTWASHILIADGGSTDRTVEIARDFINVKVAPFSSKKQMDKGLWRNPEAEHINFLIEWAEDLKSDWIVFADCDEYPNYELTNSCRRILELLDNDFVRVVRAYVYLEHLWFKNLSYFGGDWQPSLYAWRASKKLRAVNSDMAFEFPGVPSGKDKYFDILPPLCVVHNAWPTQELLERKLSFYRESGQIPGMKHPVEFGGPLELLPDWMQFIK